MLIRELIVAAALVAGKKVEVILKDDTSVPDVAKRLAQELVVNDKVAVLAVFGLTPIALAVAPTATQAKIPEVVMAAGTVALSRLFREEKLAAIIVEQHAQKILPMTDRALILERGRVAHQGASADLLADPAPLERFLGVTAR